MDLRLYVSTSTVLPNRGVESGTVIETQDSFLSLGDVKTYLVPSLFSFPIRPDRTVEVPYLVRTKGPSDSRSPPPREVPPVLSSKAQRLSRSLSKRLWTIRSPTVSPSCLLWTQTLGPFCRDSQGSFMTLLNHTHIYLSDFTRFFCLDII